MNLRPVPLRCSRREQGVRKLSRKTAAERSFSTMLLMDEDWIEKNAEDLFGPRENADPLQDVEAFRDGDMFMNEQDSLQSQMLKDLEDEDEPEGGAGVREPRRPLIPPGFSSQALELPAT